MSKAEEAARRIVKAADALKSASPGVDHRECVVIWRLACLEDGESVARAYLSRATKEGEVKRLREALILCPPHEVVVAGMRAMAQIPKDTVPGESAFLMVWQAAVRAALQRQGEGEG